MTEAEARTAIRATLAVMTRLAERTRTGTDDVLIQILRANESKLTNAVLALATDPNPPTPDRVTMALAAVGIRA